MTVGQKSEGRKNKAEKIQGQFQPQCRKNKAEKFRSTIF